MREASQGGSGRAGKGSGGVASRPGQACPCPSRADPRPALGHEDGHAGTLPRPGVGGLAKSPAAIPESAGATGAHRRLGLRAPLALKRTGRPTPPVSKKGGHHVLEGHPLRRRPGAPEGVMLKKITEIVLYAIEEAERRLTELRRFTCVGCFRTVTFRDHQEGRRVKC